ncbi:hypothetical protein QYE76_014072 [Lolium multiflorum]|uniref:Uncharacterized protein n=1 Tax=Lolium multiflorum TaxID=4521 RepID=A0AAD8U024_LOLMU|nr:hypothetical protein QYE76_014072 [Lolium multiflorum]
MAKVYPNVAVPSLALPAAGAAVAGDEEPVTLTVWRKSLLFNCRGFTVFDASGNLVYRVDSYASDSRAEVVLMDAAGRPVLTVRRKKRAIGLVGGDQWLVFPGEDTRAPPLYAVKRRGAVIGFGGSGGNKSMAHVAACGGAVGGGRYEVEGSYARRCCVVYDERRRAVAEVRPKEAMVGTDVFRMVVRPAAAGMDVSLAMAVVLALDEMFGKPSLLRNWSS